MKSRVSELHWWTLTFVLIATIAILGDLITTVDIITNRGGSEINPLMSHLFGTIGLTVGLLIAVAVKAVIAMIIGALYEVTGEREFITLGNGFVSRVHVLSTILTVLLLLALLSAPIHNLIWSYA